MVSIFKDEKDLSILKADGKGPDEREWFKGARNREGFWIEVIGSWAQVRGFPSQEGPHLSPATRWKERRAGPPQRGLGALNRVERVLGW